MRTTQMIHSIKFKDPKKVKLPPAAIGDMHPNYAFSLDSIKGKTFEFKPGVNVIVGANGCGKTSLLNVIRHLTFCDELYHSSLADGREAWKLHTLNSYEQGYWHLAELKDRYTTSTFNLRKTTDFHPQDFANSMTNFTQMWRSNRRSEGQNLMDALKILVMIIQDGEEAIRKKDDGEVMKSKRDKHGLLPHHYFKNTVLDVLSEASKEDDGYWGEMWKTMLKYYADNDISKIEGYDNYRGFTVLMDEPDKGMDVFYVEELYNFIVACPSHFQHIVVLHNIGMIHRLIEWGKANFIEMSEGYLDKVEEFFK